MLKVLTPARYNTGKQRSIEPTLDMTDTHHSDPILELKVFGLPRFLLNQRQIPFRRRQPLAIMAVLALSECPITRDEFIYLLWPDTPQTVGRQRLRRLLSEIRQAIGSGADRFLSEARVGSSLLRFDPNECRVDARAFLHLAQQARELADLDGLRAAEQALRLSTEPLLSGLELDASVEFEQWLFRQRERFARIQIDLWRRVVDGYVAIGDVNRAIEAVVRALEIDPIAEDLHRRAIWLYAKAGRRTDAIHQYSHCAALLARELEIEPEADTIALYRAVLDDQPDDARALAFPIDPSRSETAALPASNHALTRVHLPDDALRCNELVAAIEQALTGAGAVCCIQGPAGAGKTRLVQMALERVRKDMPATPVWQASARKTGYAIPFGLITGLFEAALHERLSRSHLQVRHTPLQVDLRMTEALCLLPELRAVFPALLPLQPPTSEVMTSPRMAQRRLLQALPRALRALQGDTPVVVIVEDVDQADPLSIEAIGWMLRTLPGSRMVMIITCRAADDALTEIRDQLHDRKGVQIWSLPALDCETIRQMVKQVDLPVTLAETVWQQTHGMPLATREMLHAALLARRTTSEARVPASLQEALFSHLQWLTPTTRQVLEAAAVLNGGSALWLHHVSGRTIEEVERACECLLTENWLTQVGTWYMIAHPEVQAVVLEHMSTARRHLLHWQAAALLRQYQADPFQIAVHLEAADQSDEAAAMWFQAACRAQSLSAHHAALAAIQRGLKLAVDRSLRFNLLSKQESILHDHGLRAEQETVLAALDHLVEQSSDHPEWRAEVYRKRGRLALAMNRWETAVDLLRRATTLTLQQDVEILCLLMRALTHVRQWDEASACGQRALDLARQQNDYPALARVWLTLADLEQAREQFDAAEAALHQAVRAVGKQSLLLPHIMLALGNLAGIRNDFNNAIIYAQEAQQLFVQRGLLDSEAAAEVLAARMLARLGRLDEALAAYQAAYTAYAALELTQGMAACQVNACTLMLRMGSFERGIALAQEAYERFESINDARGLCVAASNIGAALVWMGRGAEAEGWLRESYERAVATNLPAQQAAAHSNLGAALLQQGKVAEARRLMEAGLELRAAQGHLDVSVDRAFLAMACLRQGDLDAAAMHGARAVEDIQRMPQVEHPQQVWFARAQILRQQDRLDEARAALATAVDFLHQFESQLPSTQHQRYRESFFFNRALLEAWSQNVWPDPPSLV